METKIVYTGKTHTTGGRNGASKSSDEQLNIKLNQLRTLVRAGDLEKLQQLSKEGKI